MKINMLSILSFALFLFSCSKKDEVKVDCIDVQLDKLDMVANIDQEIGCNFYLELFHYKNEQYFLLGNFCADLESYPFDCDGNQFCGGESRRSCERFYNKAVSKGIVGVRLNED